MKFFLSLFSIIGFTTLQYASAQITHPASNSNNDIQVTPVLGLNSPKIIWFSAEGDNYYFTSGCKPNSGIAWYSERWGGKLLRTSITNASGQLRIIESDKAFHPAFALSQQEKGGNGTVGFTEDAEFTLEHLKANSNGGVVTIAWKASISQGQPMVFEVLKAAQGGAYSIAGAYRVTVTSGSEDFLFTEPQATPGAQYRLRVRNEAAGERYLTKLLLQDHDVNAAAIYPTVVKDVLNFIADGNGSRYTITGMDGKKVAEGILQDGPQTVAVNQLVNGSYLVTVSGEVGTTTARIVKE